MTTKEFKFANGDKVKDKITGFKGTITGTSYYLTGCSQYLVTGKPKNEFANFKQVWFDEGRLELVKAAVIKEEDVEADEGKGSDIPAPMK